MARILEEKTLENIFVYRIIMIIIIIRMQPNPFPGKKVILEPAPFLLLFLMDAVKN